MARIAVVGATGYGGAELIRLLQAHPSATVVAATSERLAGSPLAEECPWLSSKLVLCKFEPEKIEADFFFLCQESGFAMRHARTLLERARVIDLSADFRLRDRQIYEETYKIDHADWELKATYGLPELVDRNQIAEANLIANPGCYPTVSLLALMPLIRTGIGNGTPVIDAKSGVSGAGRSRKETDYLMSELTGSFKSYATVGHRHTSEIEQLAGMRVRFTPHLIPAARGIHATVHVPVATDTTHEDLLELYRSAYEHEPFVRVVTAAPSTKQVLGSNRVDIHVALDPRTSHAVICAVEDNLVKGAAGQALQNMNLMLGLPETTGLPLDGVWP